MEVAPTRLVVSVALHSGHAIFGSLGIDCNPGYDLALKPDRTPPPRPISNFWSYLSMPVVP